MRIHTRFLLLLLISVALYAVALAALWRTGQETSQQLMRAEMAVAEHNFDAILALERAPIVGAVFDYTYWDAMLEFARHRDPAWAKENIAEAFPVFGIEYAWIYDLDLQRLYAMPSASGTPPEPPAAAMLLDEDPRPDQREPLAALKFAAEHLLALINDVLDFSKIDAGRLLLEERLFDPAALANTLVRSFEPQARDKGIVLSAALATDLPARLVGDQFRLAQVRRLVQVMGSEIELDSSPERGSTFSFALALPRGEDGVEPAG